MMTGKKIWKAGGITVLLTGTIVLAGCSSTGYNRSDAVALSMQSAAAEVEAESKALDRTLNTLKSLTSEPGADLKPRYEGFKAALNDLTKAAKRTQATGDWMAKKGVEYFEAWDKQLQEIDYQHIRDLSEGRRTEATNRFERIQHRYEESQAAVQPLIAYLEDIRTALDADLTSGGVEAMKGVVQNAEVNTGKLQVALRALQTELASSSRRFSSMAPRQAGDGGKAAAP